MTKKKVLSFCAELFGTVVGEIACGVLTLGSVTNHNAQNKMLRDRQLKNNDIYKQFKS